MPANMYLHRHRHKHLRRSVPWGVLQQEESNQQSSSVSELTATPITYTSTYSTPFSFSVTLPATSATIYLTTTTITVSAHLTTTAVITNQQYTTVTSFRTLTLPSEPTADSTTFAHISVIPPHQANPEQLTKRTTTSFEDKNSDSQSGLLTLVGLLFFAPIVIFLVVLGLRALKKLDKSQGRSHERD